MKITLRNKYKSLYPFQSEELNKFTIVVGKNGSGKTQFLTLLGLKSKNDRLVENINLEIEPAILKVQVEGFVKDNSWQVGHEHWKNIINSFVVLYKSIHPKLLELGTYIKKNDLLKSSNNLRDVLLSNDKDYLDMLSNLMAIINPTLRPIINHDTHQIDIGRTNLRNQNVILTQLYHPNNRRLFKFLDVICEYKNKNIHEIAESDFYNTPIPEHLVDNEELFTSQIEVIFYSYAKRRDQNRRSYFNKVQDNEANNSISDDGFVKLFIPPWDLINEILNKHSIDFHFKGIDRNSFVSEVNPDFQLVKNSTGESVDFMDLSSGEKVIISLIIKLFTSENYSKNFLFPELLILDEPDAHLHPEMSKLLLEVLEDTFVNTYKISVIISTHSPSTIALAPEDSVYQLSNGALTSLKKISKDEALKLLTSFIPTLSIDYKNHKQVFVESPTDIKYYQTIFNKLYLEKKCIFKLYFISNSYGQGNCEQVKDIVKALREAGNTTSYGIIDWDLKNKSTDFVKVHGERSRYSIETFLYDPIYLSVLFMSSNGASRVFKELGLDESYNQFSIGNEDEAFLQNVVNWFFEKYYQIITIGEDSKKITREVSYYNGKKVHLPIWFLESQGHDFEMKLKKVFPVLTSNKFLNEGELQKELTFIIAKCFPFIPSDSASIIEEFMK
jgi:ABC-type multidrug transport system ATPase subunit